jgi:hypothetical protein
LAAQRIFKQTVISMCEKVLYDDVTFDWSKSTVAATATAPVSMIQRLLASAKETLGLAPPRRQLADADVINIAYKIVYVLEFTLTGSSQASPYVLLPLSIKASSGGGPSAFQSKLVSLAADAGVTELTDVKVATTFVNFKPVDEVFTAKNSYAPSSRPSRRPGPPAPAPTISGAGLIGLSIGVTIGGIGLFFACFLFSYTQTFRTARKSVADSLRSLRPKPRPKKPRSADEEAKDEEVELRKFDLEMADLYRSRETAFSHANVLATKKLQSHRLGGADRTPVSANGLDSKANLIDSRFKTFAGVPARLDAAGYDEDVPLWEKKWSDVHKQWYWRHRLDGLVSWTNPEPGGTPRTPSNAAGTPPGEKSGGFKASGGTARSKAPKTPASSQPELERPDAVEMAWEEKFSMKHQMPYWRNRETGTISWTLPAEVEVERSNKAVRARVAGVLTRDALRAQNARDQARLKQRGASVASSGFGLGSIGGGTRASDTRSVGSARSDGSRNSRVSGVSNAESIQSRRSQRSQGSQMSAGRVRAGTKGGDTAAAVAAAAAASAAAGSAADDAVPGYELKFSKKYGLNYWRNINTGDVVWEKPAAVPNALPPLPPSRSPR